MEKHDKGQGEPQPKKKFARFSEIYQVPLHRSYGVRKRETWLSHFNEYLATFLLILLYAWMFIMLALGAYMLIDALDHIGTLIVIIAVAWFISWKFLRIPRKRIKFLLRLRKKCKNLGYRIEYKRNVFAGMRFLKEGIDLTIDTGKKVWAVRFLPCYRYNSDLIFVDENTIKIKHNPIRLKASLFPVNARHAQRLTPKTENKRFSFGGKTKTVSYSFTDEVLHYGVKSARALIVNPVPHTIRKVEKDGAIYETGTGERMWGYTLYSGSGFLETLDRESGD